MPLQRTLIDGAMARINRTAHHPGSGAEKLVTYPVGQIVGGMNKSRPAGQVVIGMVEEFIESAESLAGQLEP